MQGINSRQSKIEPLSLIYGLHVLVWSVFLRKWRSVIGGFGLWVEGNRGPRATPAVMPSHGPSVGGLPCGVHVSPYLCLFCKSTSDALHTDNIGTLNNIKHLRRLVPIEPCGEWRNERSLRATPTTARSENCHPNTVMPIQAL